MSEVFFIVKSLQVATFCFLLSRWTFSFYYASVYLGIMFNMAVLGETVNCCGAIAMEIGLSSDNSRTQVQYFTMDGEITLVCCTKYFSTEMGHGLGPPFLITTDLTCYV